VAAFASRGAVLSGQRVVGVPVVVKGGALPGSFVMAAFAFVAEAAFMPLIIVILAVAGNAGFRQLYGIERRLVARLALGGDVLASQDVVAVNAMVEQGFIPNAGRMAVPAFVAKMALVSILVIVFPVACHTFERRVHIRAVAVAVPAFEISMAKFQFEFRLAMIERRRPPLVLVMALIAFFPKFAFVNVGLAMARAAFRKSFPIFVTGVEIVAATALGRDLLVGSFDGKFGEVMVKYRIVNHRNARISPFMIGVASIAGCFLEPPVKAAVRAYVGSGFLVAVQTEGGLRLLVERLMASLAVRIPFLVI